MTVPDAAIETEGLTKYYGPTRAVVDLNLQVPRGTIFGFLGPNGAGKTTTIRILVDLIRPTAGRARVLGYDCQRQSLAVRRHVGYLPGELRLYDNLTGAEHVRFVSRLRRQPADTPYIRQLTRTLDLDLTRHVGTYSHGNKQKLGLLLALLSDPEVLILDEPTSGLDPLVQQTVEDLLRERAAAGRTVFFSSHNLAEVQRLCHTVGIMRSGRLVTVESVDALRHRSYHIITVTFATPVPSEDFVIPGIRLQWLNGRTARFEVQDNLDGLIKAIARHQVVGIRTEEPSLEEVFLAYYQTEQPVGGRT